jgi:cob(I)alamin adenosyltransferase
MLRLDRITTGGGDGGETSLGDGSRVPKTDPRIVALGAVDELNAALGLVIADGTPQHGLPDDVAARLRSVQNDLFDLGADLCVPETAPTDDPANVPRLRLRDEQITQLETWLADVNARLQPLASFVLPGGTPAAARLHLARAVCRRAEIATVALAAAGPANDHPRVRTYLNRLSDLLFVLARAANDDGRTDVLWQPGGPPV